MTKANTARAVHPYGVIRHSKRYELYVDSRGIMTIKRFSDGSHVFLPDDRAAIILDSQDQIDRIPESSFNAVMDHDFYAVAEFNVQWMGGQR